MNHFLRLNCIPFTTQNTLQNGGPEQHALPRYPLKAFFSVYHHSLNLLIQQKTLIGLPSIHAAIQR